MHIKGAPASDVDTDVYGPQRRAAGSTLAPVRHPDAQNTVQTPTSSNGQRAASSASTAPAHRATVKTEQRLEGSLRELQSTDNFRVAEAGRQRRKFFKCLQCISVNESQACPNNENIGTLTVTDGVITTNPDLPQNRAHICLNESAHRSQEAPMEHFGVVPFEGTNWRMINFRSERTHPNFIFNFQHISGTGTGDGSDGMRFYECKQCKIAGGRTLVYVKSGRFVQQDPEDAPHICLPGRSSAQPTAQETSARDEPQSPGTVTLRPGKRRRSSAAVRGIPKKRTGVKFGPPNYTDATQKTFTYASARHPGVTYTYKGQVKPTGKSKFYCVACREIINRQNAAEGRRRRGPAIMVEDGEISERDPDYPPGVTDHLCQGGKNVGAETTVPDVPPVVNKVTKRPAPSPSKSGTPAKRTSSVVRPSTSAGSVASRPLSVGSAAQPPLHADAGELDNIGNANEALLQAIQANIQLKEEVPDATTPPADTMNDTPEPGGHSSAQPPSMSQEEFLSDVPKFGVAVRDPKKPQEKSIYYKSDFYCGHVFKFDEVDSFTQGTTTNRQYRCADCVVVTNKVRTYMGKLVPTLMTVNDRLARDPDRPLDVKHFCKMQDVPKGLLPERAMPGTEEAQPRNGSAADDEDDSDIEIIDHIKR
ncbi:hypothetical protein AAVH_07812 [Aphelenchoides avenae]|nr:hypothetical protein AAVH_07812 [Aphelenchus avenae]